MHPDGKHIGNGNGRTQHIGNHAIPYAYGIFNTTNGAIGAATAPKSITVCTFTPKYPDCNQPGELSRSGIDPVSPNSWIGFGLGLREIDSSALVGFYKIGAGCDGKTYLVFFSPACLGKIFIVGKWRDGFKEATPVLFF